MKKIILDFGGSSSAPSLTRRQIHEYIAEKMAFPNYYGNNLDALYDCLTDITEPTAVGIAIPVIPRNLAEAALRMRTLASPDEKGTGVREVPFDAMKYYLKVRRAFADAEADNPNLAVFDLMAAPADEEEGHPQQE